MQHFSIASFISDYGIRQLTPRWTDCESLGALKVRTKEVDSASGSIPETQAQLERLVTLQP